MGKLEGETRTLLRVVVLDGGGSDADVTTALIADATPFGVVITMGVAVNDAEAAELSFPKTREGSETGF